MTPVKSSAGTEVDTWRTLPNLITVLRLLLIFPFCHYSIGGDDWKALGVFVVAGVTDTLDGTLARWLNQTSRIGRLVDPIADKFLTGIAYVVLCLFRDGRPAIPLWVMTAVVVRDVLILGGCWIVYRLAHRTDFKPTIFGKLNTLLELAVIAGFLAAPHFPALSPLYIVMTFSIVVSFADYARQGIQMVRGQP